jgi:hypothetical protein
MKKTFVENINEILHSVGHHVRKINGSYHIGCIGGHGGVIVRTQEDVFLQVTAIVQRKIVRMSIAIDA